MVQSGIAPESGAIRTLPVVFRSESVGEGGGLLTNCRRTGITDNFLLTIDGRGLTQAEKHYMQWMRILLPDPECVPQWLGSVSRVKPSELHSSLPTPL